MAHNIKDTLGVVQDAGEKSQFSAAWDYKGEYISSLADDGYERFSQYSATPDTTALFAGPARFSAVTDSALRPIGMVDGLNFSSQPQLARLYEIGSNRAFFTRGKTINSVSFSKMLADQKNILAALAEQSHQFSKVKLNDLGMKAPGSDGESSNVMMNLDSEYFNIPFGLFLVFKTKGSNSSSRGKVLSAVYCEYCMFQGYNFNVQAQSPVIMENIGVEFDRVVPVAIQ